MLHQEPPKGRSSEQSHESEAKTIRGHGGIDDNRDVSKRRKETQSLLSRFEDKVNRAPCVKVDAAGTHKIQVPSRMTVPDSLCIICKLGTRMVAIRVARQCSVPKLASASAHWTPLVESFDGLTRKADLRPKAASSPAFHCPPRQHLKCVFDPEAEYWCGTGKDGRLSSKGRRA